MVIGLFSKPTDAEACLTNLTEADFDPKDISVIAQEKDIIDALGTFSGPLDDISIAELAGKFVDFGLSKQQYTTYVEKIRTGYVLIAVTAEDDAISNVKEILLDNHAENILVI